MSLNQQYIVTDLESYKKCFELSLNLILEPGAIELPEILAMYDYRSLRALITFSLAGCTVVEIHDEKSYEIICKMVREHPNIGSDHKAYRMKNRYEQRYPVLGKRTREVDPPAVVAPPMPAVVATESPTARDPRARGIEEERRKIMGELMEMLRVRQEEILRRQAASQ
jgi:hypothetical protein